MVGLALTQRDQVSEPVVGQSSSSTQLADLPETAQVDDGPTTIDYEVAPPVNTLIPQVCGSGEGDDCSPYAPLPVADGVSDFYVGPADLGTPVVALHDFVPLVRCAELDPSATVCNRLEGFAGVALTRYPSEVTVDTTGVELNHAPDVEIGTTFTEITPLQYAGEWVSKMAAGGNIEEVVVRGNPAIIINEFASRYVVWNERPGVLVWVKAANDAQGDLLAIAEGVRRVPGQTTLPGLSAFPTNST